MCRLVSNLPVLVVLHFAITASVRAGEKDEVVREPATARRATFLRPADSHQGKVRARLIPGHPVDSKPADFSSYRYGHRYGHHYAYGYRYGYYRGHAYRYGHYYRPYAFAYPYYTPPGFRRYAYSRGYYWRGYAPHYAYPLSRYPHLYYFSPGFRRHYAAALHHYALYGRWYLDPPRWEPMYPGDWGPYVLPPCPEPSSSSGYSGCYHW